MEGMPRSTKFVRRSIASQMKSVLSVKKWSGQNPTSPTACYGHAVDFSSKARRCIHLYMARTFPYQPDFVVNDRCHESSELHAVSRHVCMWHTVKLAAVACAGTGW